MGTGPLPNVWRLRDGDAEGWAMTAERRPIVPRGNPDVEPLDRLLEAVVFAMRRAAAKRASAPDRAKITIVRRDDAA